MPALMHWPVDMQASGKLWPPMCHGYPRPEQNDMVLAAVMQHFARRSAWDAAIEFFTQVVREHAPAIVQLSVALERVQRHNDAIQVRSCSHWLKMLYFCMCLR